jgi:hypothetical protein
MRFLVFSGCGGCWAHGEGFFGRVRRVSSVSCACVRRAMPGGREWLPGVRCPVGQQFARRA